MPNSTHELPYVTQVLITRIERIHQTLAVGRSSLDDADRQYAALCGETGVDRSGLLSYKLGVVENTLAGVYELVGGAS